LHATSPPCCVGKHERAASTRCSTLAFLAQQLFLFTFLLSDDAKMLHHFLRHYHRLGVLPTHTGAVVRVREGSSAASLTATLGVLQAAGVLRERVRVIDQPPSDELKLRLINKHISSLPPDAFVIYGDVDELFEYPCALEKLVRKQRFTCLSGGMCDQMAASGNISELQYEPDVALQYPLACRIRQRYFSNHMVYHKTILSRVRTASNGTILFRTTHAVAASSGSRRHHASQPATQESMPCDHGGIVRHYTMTAEAMEGNREKMRLESRSIDGKALNYANATCSFPYGGKKHKLVCSDYSTLYGVQRQQVTKFERVGSAVPTSWLCPGCSSNGNVTRCKPWTAC